MNKRVVSVVLVGALGVGAVSTLALTPALAAETAAVVSQRLTDLEAALKGLVSDGTLTQAQADKVASTLDAALPRGGPGGRHGRGGPGPGLDDAAAVLGMSVEQLRTALGTDTSLADVAAAKGISKATLVARLVAAARSRIAADVKAGRLTQARADQLTADLKARITEKVDRVGPPMPKDHPAPPAVTSPSTSTSGTAAT